MSSYWLPCSCGKQTRVSAAQAGETVACVCGLSLEVPTLRGLKDLQSAESAGAKAAPRAVWEDRHRVAFLLVLVAIAALAATGYMGLRLPKSLVYVSTKDAEAELRNNSPQEVMDTFEKLKRGLTANPPIESSDDVRRVMLWGMGIAGSLAVAALGGAGVVLASGGRAKR